MAAAGDAAADRGDHAGHRGDAAEELGPVVHVAGQEDRDALGLEPVDGVGRDVVTGASGHGVPALAGGGVHVEHVELAAGVAVAQPQDRLRPVGVHEVDREVAAGDELELRVVVEDRVVGLAGAERVAGVGGVAGHRRDAVELVGLELLGAEDVDAEGPDPGDRADVARAGRGVPRVVPARGGVLAAEDVEGADLEGHRLARGLALGGPAQRGVDLGLGHVDDDAAGDDLLRLRLLGRRARSRVAVRRAPRDDGRLVVGRLAAHLALLLGHAAHQRLLRAEAQRRVGGRLGVLLAESDGHHDSRGDAHKEDRDQGEDGPEGAVTTAASVFRVPPGHAGESIGAAP